MSAGRRRSTRTRACDISPAVREIVNRRDKGCIFCLAAYELPQGYIPELFRMEIMHFVSRSTGGLGIPENLAKGCFYHHRMLDQSPRRNEMKLIFESYLRNHYPDWEESRLYFAKDEQERIRDYGKTETEGAAQVPAENLEH
nr:MAG TPA: 5-methylcytosine-specific restriction enzyme A [Caudoviricetes sp.]